MHNFMNKFLINQGRWLSQSKNVSSEIWDGNIFIKKKKSLIFIKIFGN